MTGPVSNASRESRYPRINAAVYCRPAGWLEVARRRRHGFSLGSARVLSDVPAKRGERLSLDFYPSRGQVVACLAEVAWTRALGPSDPAPYEVGLDFLDASARDRAGLADLLASAN